MARIVKVATISMNLCEYSKKPRDMSLTDYEIMWLDKNISQVLPDKPDLIVLPECCDVPDGIPLDDMRRYFEERGEKTVDHIRKIARENNVYIMFGAYRFLPDKTARNSCYMIGRQGETVGIYDKNYIVPTETKFHNIQCGESETIFECDFGRVGAIICFDINFDEMRLKYKRAKPDLMVFISYFGGGLMRNFFAFDTRSYFVASCAYGCPGEIINPLGLSLCVTSYHYNYVVKEINLDYEVVHMDNHREKIRRAKEKYGSLLEVIGDVGYVGVAIISYFGTDKTVRDILAEFEISDVEEYLEYARRHRAGQVKNKN